MAYIVYTCPYYRREERLCMICEGGMVRFRDLDHRNDYVNAYCTANPGWQACSIAQAITKSYERKDRNGKKHR
jgi:hypothetical protein